MGNICEHVVGSEMRSKLKLVASMITYMTGNKVDVHVDTTYFDYDQNWKWTTLIAGYGSNSYQMLYPSDMDEIELAETLVELAAIAQRLYTEQKNLLERR